MLYLQISFSAHLALLVVEVNKELGIVLKSTSLCQVFIQSKNINIADLENFFFIISVNLEEWVHDSGKSYLTGWNHHVKKVRNGNICVGATVHISKGTARYLVVELV